MTEHFLRYAYPGTERERVLAGIREAVTRHYTAHGSASASERDTIYVVLDVLDRDFDGASLQRPYRVPLAREILTALGWADGWRTEQVVKRVFVVRRVSDGLYRAGSGWGDLRRAKVWYRKQDAGLSAMVNSGGRDSGEIEVVELHAIDPAPAGFVHVALPAGHDVLADFLENIGLAEQAMALRKAAPVAVQSTKNDETRHEAAK